MLHQAARRGERIFRHKIPHAAGRILPPDTAMPTRVEMLTGRWHSPLYPHQDTIPRPPAESKMMEFRSLTPGTMHLKQGRGLLTLRALQISGHTDMEMRQVNLTLRMSEKQ